MRVTHVCVPALVLFVTLLAAPVRGAVFVDNLRVEVLEVPEPAAALGVVGLLGLILGRAQRSPTREGTARWTEGAS